MHMALRDLSSRPLLVGGEDMRPLIEAEREKVFAFARAVRCGAVRGATGAPFTDVVNIGIGGSDLGPAMAARALSPFRGEGPRMHFVSNVDGADIADTLNSLDPARTLFIVSSKTFTTQETMTNAASARALHRRGARRGRGGRPFRGGFDAARQGRRLRHRAGRVFGFWDWVGGRYSIWSAIGLALAIAIGPEHFLHFCAAATISTRISSTAPLEHNIPVLMGLLGVWHRNSGMRARMPSSPTTSGSRGSPPICSSSTWSRTASR